MMEVAVATLMTSTPLSMCAGPFLKIVDVIVAGAGVGSANTWKNLVVFDVSRGKYHTKTPFIH